MAKMSGLVTKLGSSDTAKAAASRMPQLPAKKSTGIDTSAPATPEPTLASAQEAAPQEPETASPADLHSSAPLPGDRIEAIPIASIRRSPFQVRTMGSDAYIESLMESIRGSKVISPIVVRPVPADPKCTTVVHQFEFVAGEHRAEACKRLGHTTITAIIREMTDQEAAVALAADNGVRKDLDDYDRYKHVKMLQAHGFATSNTEAGATLRLSRSAVSNLMIAFEALPPEAAEILEQNPGCLGYKTAYAIRDYSKEHPDLVLEALRKLVADMSITEAEDDSKVDPATRPSRLTQSGLREWIERKLRPKGVRSGVTRSSMTILRPGYPAIQMIVTEKDAVIRAEGIDTTALHKLISANLDKLLPG